MRNPWHCETKVIRLSAAREIANKVTGFDTKTEKPSQWVKQFAQYQKNPFADRNLVCMRQTESDKPWIIGQENIIPLNCRWLLYHALLCLSLFSVPLSVSSFKISTIYFLLLRVSKAGMHNKTW